MSRVVLACPSSVQNWAIARLRATSVLAHVAVGEWPSFDRVNSVREFRMLEGTAIAAAVRGFQF